MTSIKKLLICASAVGVAAGIAYWVYTKEKANNKANASPVTNIVHFTTEAPEPKKRENANATDKINQAKSECVQDVYERHTAAGEVLKDAYSNIMENFVEDYSVEEADGVKEKGNKTIVDSEDVSVIKELDSILDELDDLLN